MLLKPFHVKQYASANHRFFKPSVVQLLMKAFPRYFGTVVASKFADEIVQLFERLHPERDFLKPGQVFWNTLDKNTRGDSPNRRFVPVTLTIVNQEDIKMLTQGCKVSKVKQFAIARMFKEAYQQGGILSTRDLALLTLATPSTISVARSKFEQENEVVLPHPGVLHDMGSTITHKKQIVYKVIVEKKDTTLVAKETNHSQKAVDHYLHDYNRVKTVFKINTNLNYIHLVTNIAKSVVKQYIELYEQFEKST